VPKNIDPGGSQAGQFSRSASGAQQPSCCIANALDDPEATFCIECGKPLLRCMAFQECGGIVNDKGLCPVCVKPHLHITEGATMKAPVGGSVAVPLELANGSQVDRPLFIKRLWSRERGDWREERLGWEKLQPGESAPASVTACELDKPGLHEIQIMWELATQWKARAEHFAFSTSLLLEIASEEAGHSTNIHINAENQQGNVMQFTVPESSGGGASRTITKLDMPVTPLDRMERELGLRGIDGEAVLPRSAKFVLKGFGKDQTLADSRPIVTSDATLRFGRALLRNKGSDIDARLLLQGEDGSIDEKLSAFVSRRHFEIFVENERPILKVLSENGVRVNGKAYGIDKLVQLADGAEIAPLVKAPELLNLQVRFRRERSNISEVELSRTPAWRESGE